VLDQQLQTSFTLPVVDVEPVRQPQSSLGWHGKALAIQEIERDCIEPRLLGAYDDGLGNRWQDPHALRFFAGGNVNLPYLSDGMWFMTQFRRWGLLREDPDYLGVARQVQQLGLYRQAAEALGITTKDQDMRSSQLIDGKIWDGSDPASYARSFRLHALADHTHRQALR
jgi:nitrate/nitrite transport system substrate-binding protein